MFRQARGNAGQSVVVKVQLSQVGDIRHRTIFHSADLIVAQTESVEKWGDVDMSERVEKQGS